jgi:hypothetical protein
VKADHSNEETMIFVLLLVSQICLWVNLILLTR